MKIGSKNIGIFVVLVVLALVVGVLSLKKNDSPFSYGNTPTRIGEVQYEPEFISENISWNKGQEKYIPEAYTEEIPALRQALVQKYEGENLNGMYIAILGLMGRDQWLVLSGAVYDKNTNELIPSEGIKIYAEKITESWHISEPGDEDFCDYAKRAPEGFVDEFYLVNCN